MSGYEDVKMPFGKHKGELVADLPDSYLNWLLGQDFVKIGYNQLWKMVAKESKYRKDFDIKY